MITFYTTYRAEFHRENTSRTFSLIKTQQRTSHIHIQIKKQTSHPIVSGLCTELYIWMGGNVHCTFNCIENKLL